MEPVFQVTDEMRQSLLSSTMKSWVKKNLWQIIDKTKIPHKPGVYIYKNQEGEIIYVGKAIDLYHRIASYLSSRELDQKTTDLVKNIASCETIVVASELEALILEANLIKKYLPKFNIRLTDDKDYLYIKVTKEEYPRILTARKADLGGVKEFFGPFPSSRIIRTTLKKIRRIFPWCSNPVSFGRPCFYYHLHLCPGPCAGKINRQDYMKIINKFINFMQGKKEQVLSDLEEEMKIFSKELNFEQAEQTKKMIEGLNYMLQPNQAQVYLETPNFIDLQNQESVKKLQEDLKLQNLPERIECYDISNLGGKDAVGSLVVLSSGEIDKKWYRKFKIHLEEKPNDVAMMKEMVGRRVKHQEWPKPDLILVDGGKGQVSGVKEILDQAGWNIPVYGLAKRTEWLFHSNGEAIKLPKSSLSLRLLQKIRDEAHRFAISYHRKLRANNFPRVV